MRALPVSLFLALFYAVPTAPADGEPGDYARELVARADDLRLFDQEYWHLLLHYKKTLFGYRSIIDDPAFFLAPDGKRNPRAELRATLESFFQPVEGEELAHPMCRFIARYHWLKEQLAIDESRLPHAACETFGRVYEQLRPASATLVFPAAYLNNPASMFGHTLLIVEPRDKNRLLARSVSYGARLRGSFSPFFIINSFLGVYRGYYTTQAYYDKVEEYGDVGHRDMWEYELDFSHEELMRMIMHTWELQEIYSKYYFLTENCSYNLLYLLDAARPSLRLTRAFRGWVIPINTVKVVVRKGLVKDVAYRPAPVTVIRHLSRTLDPAGVKQVARVARGEAEPETLLDAFPDPAARRTALDLASDYIQFLYAEKQLSPDAYRRLFLGTLKTRSRLGRAGDDRDRPPQPTRADFGHDAGRLALGAGLQDGHPFQTLRYRPANHGLLDNDAGYTRGAQIELMSADLRYYAGRQHLQLRNLDFVDVFSIAPRDQLLKALSWRGLVGLTQKDFREGDDRLVFQTRVGAGYAWDLALPGLFYIMGEGRLEAEEDYADKYVAAPGLIIGALKECTPRWKLRLQGEGAYFVSGREDFESYKVSLDQNLTISRNNALALELSYSGNDGYNFTEAQLLWNLFF